jgi:toxin ParE1/3/4
VSGHYVIRPKADRDLDEQAYYLATNASAQLGHRFLLAAHETFAVLATQPQMGWHPRLRRTELASLRVFSIAGFEKMLVLYRPRANGVDILRVVHGSRNVRALLRREGVE